MLAPFRTLIAVLALSLAANPVSAQPDAAAPEARRPFAHQTLPSADLHAVAAEWSGVPDVSAGEVPLEYRYLVAEAEEYTPWRPWPIDPDAGGRRGLLFLPGAAIEYEIRAVGPTGQSVGDNGPLPRGDTRFHRRAYVSRARTPPRSASARLTPRTRSRTCPPPPTFDRLTWCPSGTCPEDATPEPVVPAHLIVHHSGTSLPDDADFALAVQAIYDYHTAFNGWDDIGYNYLVAPDGTVYEGRGAALQGAHFCGANEETLGICLLGNFEEEPPEPAALTALGTLGSYLARELDIDPLGERRHAPSNALLAGIAGHRQGCATICPGDELFALLPRVRDTVAAELTRCGGLVSVGEATPVQTSAPHIAPNPVRDILELRGGTDRVDHAQIVDSRGRVVRRLSGGRTRWAIEPGALRPGVYHLVVERRGRRSTQPFRYQP